MAIMYNPQIEGRGVGKNEKKTFSNCLQILFSHLSDIIKANLLFILAILPLILLSGLICAIVLPDVNILKTEFQFQFVFQIMLIPLPFAFSGPALSGLTRITRDIGREIHVDIWDDFFDVFKRTFVHSIILSIMSYVFYVAAFFAFMVYWGEWLFFAVTTIATLYFTLMQKYLYVMNVSLDLGVFKMYKNAFLLILADIKNSMKGLIFVLVEIALIAFYVVTSMFGWLLIVISAFFVVTIQFALPALFENYYLFQSVIKNVVEPYYGTKTDESIEEEINKKNKYENTDSVTEESEYVYINGKLVLREIAEQTPIFDDKT